MSKSKRNLLFAALISTSILFSCNPGSGKVDPVDPTPTPTPTPVVDYDALAKSYSEEIEESKTALTEYPESLNKVFNLLSSFEVNLIKSKNSGYALNSIIPFRELAYSGSEWSIIASKSTTSVSNLFNTYKSSEYAKTNWINVGDNYIDQFDKQIDFYHMLAVLNTYMYSSGDTARDLSSFGGDLCQLVTELKAQPEGTDLLDYATNKSKLFSDYDLYADIDGTNIYEIYSNAKYYKKVRGISTAISYYYLNLKTNEDRMNAFKNTFDSFTADVIYSRIKNNLYLIIWNSKNGISFSDDKNLFMIAIQAFINRVNVKS